MQNKFRIAILGIGGVGGFIGGKLTAAYNNATDVELIFIARGANAQAIKENGLHLITHTEEITAHPHTITDNPADLRDINLLICCTKTYDLENSIRTLAPAITPNTLILPLLNGVDSTEVIQAVVPHAKVLQGCIYIVSKLTAPGTVQQRGEFHSLHFGGDKAWAAEMDHLLHLFQNAGITTTLENNIHEKVWSKFSFISPIATYTSAQNISIGRILESPEHTTAITTLMTELQTLAQSLHINLPPDTTDRNFATMRKLPYETTSSMHADFTANKSTELEQLTGYVVNKATVQSLSLNSYPAMYKLLRSR